jgi:hypothetical protein
MSSHMHMHANALPVLSYTPASNVLCRLTLVLEIEIETLTETLSFPEKREPILGARGGHVACATEMWGRTTLNAPVEALKTRARTRRARMDILILSRARRTRLLGNPNDTLYHCNASSVDPLASGARWETSEPRSTRTSCATPNGVCRGSNKCTGPTQMTR